MHSIYINTAAYIYTAKRSVSRGFSSSSSIYNITRLISARDDTRDTKKLKLGRKQPYETRKRRQQATYIMLKYYIYSCIYACATPTPPLAPWLGLYKILFHFEALLHNHIFLQTPPLLCNILHNITSYCTPPPNFERVVFDVFGGIFCFFRGAGFWMGTSRCLNKNRSRHGKGGIIAHYTLLCNTSPPAPLYCLRYCAINFPYDPLDCNKILAISFKGQALTRMMPHEWYAYENLTSNSKKTCRGLGSSVKR